MVWNEQWNYEMMKWTKKWWNEHWNDEILEGLSKSVKHTKSPSALAYDGMNSEMIKWTRKWWNEQWNDETLEGLSIVWNTLNGQVHWHMMKWTFT